MLDQYTSKNSNPPFIQSDTDLLLRAVSVTDDESSLTQNPLIYSDPELQVPATSQEPLSNIPGSVNAELSEQSMQDDIARDEEANVQTQPTNRIRLKSDLEIRDQHYQKQRQYSEQKRHKRLTDIDFEGILNLIGGCSNWQVVVYLMISVQQVPHAMFNLSVVYMMYQPDHWCKIPFFNAEVFLKTNTTSYTWDDVLNSHIAFPTVKNKQRGDMDWHDQCHYYERNYVHMKNIPFAQASNYSTDGVLVLRCEEWEYDQSVMEKTVVTEWNRVCDNNWSRAHVHMSYSLGYLVGGLLGGFVSDRYGRKTAIYGFGILSMIFGFLLAYSREFEIFLVVRFLLAASNEAADLAAYVLCMEITGVKYRSIVGSLLQAPWACGYAFLALVAYLTKSWTSIHMITVGLHCVALIFIHLLPESPRWLIMMNRVEDAEKIIRKACKNNKSSLPSDLGLIATALVYYGLVIALSDQSSPGRSVFDGNFFLNNAIAGAIELPTLALCVFLLRYGRKRSQMITLIGAGSLIMVAMLAMNNKRTTASNLVKLHGKASIQGAFNILYIFTSELNPTIVRNSAVGISSMIARMGAGASGYIAILSDVTLAIVPMLIFAVFSLCAGFLVIFLPETQDVPLPDTIWLVNWSSKLLSCPFVSRDNLECSIVIRPTRGTFLQYEVGDDLHIGISDGLSIVYSYWWSGICSENTSWDRSVVVWRFTAEKNEFTRAVLTFLSGNSTRFRGELYNDSDWNCFDFVMEFLRFIEFRVYTKTDFVAEFVQNSLSTAVKYSRLMKRIEEYGFVLL
ncbi:transporter, major facilitator family protein [Dictyocaulus viviparus]|uniref:Transporter, major facilitator family protein n=1 Tax=Dictyocaulus viviparus TaxID=29172 RepID=A0A0D8XLB3_DICVI|nr:transporter, major facilitator family protein [Dictyocaulus viviparus]